MIVREKSGRATDWQWIRGIGWWAAGTVDMPRMVGLNRMSDWIDRDRHGRIIGRAPCEPLFRVTFT